MKRTIKVFIGETPQEVGMLYYNSQGRRENAAFEYTSSWLATAHRFAIDPALPLVTGPQFHKKTAVGSAFHGVIADTEPDGWGRRVILRDHAKQRQEARKTNAKIEAPLLNSLDFLLAVDDTSRVGALRFQDENGIFQRTSADRQRTTPPMIELGQLLSATRAVETNNETAADLAYLRGRGTSLGGLRPKCTILDEAGCLSIGKFPSVTDERAVTKGEVLALRLARAAGINAAEARIVESDGIPVALIRRFDRANDAGRIPYASAATMLGAEMDDGATHTYTDIVDVLRSNGAASQADIEELWRRIAFSILITNTDDHLHNHGFLHVGGDHWRLSPAFDINPFPERERELKTWVSADAGPEATIAALMSVTPYFLITTSQAQTILRQVESAVARWREEGRAIGMTDAELEAFADAFEHSERAAARSIMT